MIPLKYNIGNLKARRVSTLMTILGIGVVIAVMLSMQALDRGVTLATQSTASKNVLIVMREGSEAEISSWVTRDAEQIRGLWNPTYRAWFPGGSTDPEIGILTVEIDRVEYWDVPSSRLVRLWGVARALATGQPAEAGERGSFAFGEP